LILYYYYSNDQMIKLISNFRSEYQSRNFIKRLWNFDIIPLYHPISHHFYI